MKRRAVGGSARRKAISLDTKLRILKRADEGVGASAVGREFRMAESTIRTIVKNKQRLLESGRTATPLLARQLSRTRGAIFERMENRLSSWVQETNSKDVPVTQADIMLEAKRLFDQLKGAEADSAVEFKASRGWFERFRRRANLVLVRLSTKGAPGKLPKTVRAVVHNSSHHSLLSKEKKITMKESKAFYSTRKNARLKPRRREKAGSPRVTPRLHQIKERKEKAKSGAAADKVGHHDNYNNGGNMEGSKGNEDTTGSKDSGAGNIENDAGEQGTKESTVASPKEMIEPDGSVGPGNKRSHSTEEDGAQEEIRKKRRKDGGKNGSTSGGSPKSVIESEGEDAKSVGSPGPKVPPLKIVIAGASLEDQGGGRAGKNGGSRHHLPYVVSTSSGGEGEATSPHSDEQEDHGKRVLRSHRSGGGSGNSSPATAAGETPPRCGILSPPPQQPEPEEKPADDPTPLELHPRKRKLRPKESATSNSGQATTSQAQSPTDQSTELQHFSELSVSNSYQLFLNIRKQIERKRKGLFPVQPKPPQGFKDYLMNRCTYVLAGNAANRVPPPSGNPPSTVPAQIKDLFLAQEKDRHRLLMQHVIEKEKLVLSVEQEILRVHGRAARALANQALPFSACTILRDEEVYSAITPEQEEKDRNARSRYNGRLFLSWLQDVDDKWEKIKESMLLRHHNEAESLHAVQLMDWEWKLKEIGLCEFKVRPNIDDTHVPMVHVSDDFDLLPA